MELRWLVLCDKNGVKSEPVLQYWNKLYEQWDDLPVDEKKSEEYDAGEMSEWQNDYPVQDD